jgi:hypothetical protein
MSRKWQLEKQKNTETEDPEADLGTRDITEMTDGAGDGGVVRWSPFQEFGSTSCWTGIPPVQKAWWKLGWLYPAYVSLVHGRSRITPSSCKLRLAHWILEFCRMPKKESRIEECLSFKHNLGRETSVSGEAIVSHTTNIISRQSQAVQFKPNAILRLKFCLSCAGPSSSESQSNLRSFESRPAG